MFKKKIFTGFYGKDNKKIYVGDKCRTHDHTGKEWTGKIINQNGHYAFMSNYTTWIHDYWSKDIEVIS